MNEEEFRKFKRKTKMEYIKLTARLLMMILALLNLGLAFGFYMTEEYSRVSVHLLAALLCMYGEKEVENGH